MAKIEKTVENERMITATFTQSEWNEIWAAMGVTNHSMREGLLKKYNYCTDFEHALTLYEFLKTETL